MKKGETYEDRDRRANGRRIRLVGAREGRWRAVSLGSGRESLLSEKTLARSFRKVDDPREPPAEATRKRGEGSNVGRPVKALADVIEVIQDLETRERPVTVAAIHEEIETQGISLNEWTIRRYLSRLIDSGLVEIRTQGRHEFWTYGSVGGTK